MKLIISWEESHSEISNNSIRASSGGLCLFFVGVCFLVQEQAQEFTDV